MFALHRIALAPARKPLRIGFLFTHKNGDFGAISVTERSCHAPILRMERHLSDWFCAYFGAVSTGIWTEMNKWERGLESTKTEVNIQE